MSGSKLGPGTLLWMLLAAAPLSLAPLSFARSSSSSAALRAALSTPVPGFDNGGQPLIPTLIEMARTMRIPMGIEKVTPAALRKPVRITLRGGTVATLLDACVRQLPDYHWAVHEGVVDVYGEKERADKLNLFNYVIPHLEVRRGNLNLVNARLRMATPSSLPIRRSALPSAGVGGTFGDTIGAIGIGPPHVDFVANQETVRSILNRIVALSKGRAIWIARVPPGGLSQAPDGGLWLLTPPSLDAIMPSLDRSLYSDN